MNFRSSNENETIDLGRKVAKKLKSGDIVCLFGDLGSGKTTFVKGLASGLRINSKKVNSPTFVLMNLYEGRLPLFHFDLYRIDDLKEISTIGYEEFLYDKGVAVIEWADKMGELLPKKFLKVEMLHQKETQRAIKISAKGKEYEHIINRDIH